MSDLIDIAEWPDCPECGRYKVNMWAGEGVCSPCTEKKIGAVLMERRYRLTRADDMSWAGPEATMRALESA